MKRSRTELEDVVLQYRSDGVKNGRGRKLSTKEFAKQVDIGESTLYLRWREPESFQDKELLAIAEFIGMPLEQVKEKAIIKKTPDNQSSLSQESSSNKNSALIEKESPLKRSNPYFRFVSFALLVAIFLSVILHAVPIFKKWLLPVEFHSTFQGHAEDLDANELGQALDLHSKLYNYKLIDLITTTRGGKIEMTGTLEWSSLLEGGEVDKTAIFSASGTHIGDTAALIYAIEDEVYQESWIGTLTLHLPRSGPISGYWVSQHTEEDPISDGPFAIGRVKLKR
ncbi:hypothetical protein QWZ04_17225 [Vibrio tapetis subsp. quintayensis]|uniref:hypothetical protein n=1 Tax=Vibrio tapetis TaxID=52443 RepID=UPI0025B2A513|nr:hypothetical protein [Vibrio tapetis]MDN3682050.1 hypothetical protein [Vibrio tapetis subsp. quintayensis]